MTTEEESSDRPGRPDADVRKRKGRYQAITQLGAGESAAIIGKTTARRLTRCSRHYRIMRYLRRLFYGLMIFAYVFVPLFYRQCTWIRRNIIYLNVLNSLPANGSLEDPVALGGFSCARAFRFRPEPGVSLGAWHVVPRSLVESRCHLNGSIKDIGEEEFSDDRPVVFHLHGSGGSRGSSNRLRLIRLLTGPEIDAHVLTLDYRGFADSSPLKPSVASITGDVVALYEWLRKDKRVDNRRIFFYGQSLGTGISVHLAHEVQNRVVSGREGRPLKLGGPAGLILEAPYTDIAEASSLHPYTYFHTYFPLKRACFVEPIKHPDTFWDSRSRISEIQAPVLILHAEDDDTIPYVLGKRLYDLAKESRDPRLLTTRMVTYEAAKGYGHNEIDADPGFQSLLHSYIGEFRGTGKR